MWAELCLTKPVSLFHKPFLYGDGVPCLTNTNSSR
jgi:hypothetical protein